MLTSLGRAYATLSFAAPPAALVGILGLLAGFRENGPQSQGLGALVVIAAAVLGALLLNALVAAVLSAAVRQVRPRARHVAIAALIASALLAAVPLLGGV